MKSNGFQPREERTGVPTTRTMNAVHTDCYFPSSDTIPMR